MTKQKTPHQSSRRDQYTAVLEDLRSHFKVFKESLDSVRDMVAINSERMVKLEIDLTQVKIELTEMKSELAEVKLELVELKSDSEIMKSELAIIRHNQITRDEFKLLETRVSRLEKVSSGHHG